MTNPFTDQATFMLAGDQTTGVNNPQQMSLYLDLVNEEVNELFEATSYEELVKEACDVIVVTLGLLHSTGVDVEEAWRRVHASNMSKCIDGKLVKREDGKIQKPDTYAAPDIAELVTAIAFHPDALPPVTVDAV